MQSQTSIEEHSSVLLPATNSSLNIASNTSHPATSRKRKSSDLESNSNGVDTEIFTAHLLSKNSTISFAPVTVVARACLPLAWLSTVASSPSLLFEADISSVEVWEQRVLIVRKVPNGGLYAVEQVVGDTYIACALHSWVTESWCHDAAVGIIAEAKVEDLLLADDDNSQRGHLQTGRRSGSIPSSTALPTPKSPKQAKNRRGALARMSILAPSNAAADHIIMKTAAPPVIRQGSTADLIAKDVAYNNVMPSLSQEPIVSQSLVQEPLPITLAAQTSLQNPFDTAATVGEPVMLEVERLTVPESANALPAIDLNPLAADRLRKQYFEHLYTSKTSLAFYVKGPLSRARAHIRTVEDAATAINELSTFYEQSILSTKKIDLKYKESVAKVIKELPVLRQDEDISTVTEHKKKSRKKKTKLGKDFLWPEEEDFIAKWWRGRDLSGTVGENDQLEDVRKELANLRMRETKMQMLLVLEIMLLEAAASKLAESDTAVDPGAVSGLADKPAPSYPEVKIESIEEDLSAATLATTPHKQPKRGKKRDWSAEIDAIVDRLCIWHTVSLDDLVSTADDKSCKKDANGSTAAKPNDSHRDFCKDVLLLFYSAKLPVQIKAIWRKLGGPERSPTRSKQVQPTLGLHRSSLSTSTVPKAKPGETLSKRTLERVLSEDHQLHRHASPPIALSRASSISAPIIATLKREPSERPTSRGGMLAKSVSFSNREIDLVADQKAHDMKRRKLDRLAQQKKDLEAAIDALKKPDRKTVASQIMDEAEERKKLEIDKKMAVQISATPRRFKGQSQLMEEPQLPPMPMPSLVPRRQEVMTVIPSSTMKPRIRPGMSSSTNKPRSSATKRAVLAAIHDTPSRRHEGKTSNPLELPTVPRASSEVAESATIAATPAPTRKAVDVECLPSPEPTLPSSQPQPPSSQLTDTGTGSLMKRSRRQVLFTRLKQPEVRLDEVFRDAPVIPEQAGHMMDRVMGGRGRGMEDGFEPLQTARSSKPKELYLREQKFGSANGADVDDGDIYDKLGWNDDFDL